MGMCLILVLSHPMIKPKKGFMAETMNPWVGHWLSDWLVVLRITGRLITGLLPFSGLWLRENLLKGGPHVAASAELC